MINLYNVIAEQFPNFVRSDYPMFIEFITAYYKWLDIQSKSSGLRHTTDIDSTLDYVVVELLYNAVAIQPLLFEHQIVVGVTSGARAIVRQVKTHTTSHTIYVDYITSDAKFQNSEVLYVEHDDGTPSNNLTRATVVASNATGTVPNLFIDSFEKQLDVYNIFDGVQNFNARLLKNIKDIYAAKGSEQALAYILTTIHGGLNTVIRYPSDQILRVSDGRWNQESFITVNTNTGTFPQDPVKFKLFSLDQLTSQEINITRIESFTGNIYRLYFKNIRTLSVNVGQVINIVDINNNIIFIGSVINSPSTINIYAGGSHWQLGQLITIPGTEKDSLVRVVGVDGIGKILQLEIIDFGYGHANFQTANVSPYPSFPLTRDYYQITTTITTNVPGVTASHNLVIADSTIGTYETMKYTKGSTVTSQQLTSTPSNNLIDYNLSVDQWHQSKAVLYITNSALATLPGYWADNKGQVSNEYIRLEDNYYYQQFSYVIDSDVIAQNYVELTNKFHPAGLIRFTNYAAITDFTDAGIVADISLQIFPLTLNLFDVGIIDDSFLVKNFTKAPPNETVVTSDSHAATFIKGSEGITGDTIDMSAAHIGSQQPSIFYFDVVNYAIEDYAATELYLNIS